MRTVCLIILAASFCHGQVVPQAGDYVSRAYLETLRATKSPQAAQRINSPVGVRVEKASNSTLDLILHDFHEGNTVAKILPSGRIELVPDSFPDSIRISRNNEIIIWSASKSHTFRFVGHAETWAASLLFKARYVDSRSQYYSFTDSSFVLPIGLSIPFHLSLDVSEPPGVDCILLDKTCYAFQFKDSVLSIFGVSGDEGEVVADRPTWVLHRQSSSGTP